MYERFIFHTTAYKVDRYKQYNFGYFTHVSAVMENVKLIAHTHSGIAKCFFSTSPVSLHGDGRYDDDPHLYSCQLHRHKF